MQPSLTAFENVLGLKWVIQLSLFISCQLKGLTALVASKHC